jgi:hypothetical protein
VIFNLHGQWKDVYVTEGFTLTHLHACKICFTIMFIEVNVWVILVLILFIKGNFWVNYVLELQIRCHHKE